MSWFTELLCSVGFAAISPRTAAGRRAIWMGAWLLSGTLLAAQYEVTGYVYRDANGNGKRETAEAGIAGVGVSNGVQVAVTDAQGRYSLPIGSDAIIFVIKPTGYALPVDENNQPRFYYIHKPHGSPKLKYDAVAPTGPLPASVDFALTPRDEPAGFTALIFGDPQPLNEREMDYFSRGIVAEVKGIKGVAFGLSLGDLIWDRLDLFKSYRTTVAQVGVPWFNLLGNHDANVDAATDQLSDESYEANFGPPNYAFNHGSAHFIILDNILLPDPRGTHEYWGGFRPDQFEFIANDLKHVGKDQLVVMAFHIPLIKNAVRDEDKQRLFDLLKDYPHTLLLTAHTHYQAQFFHGRNEGWGRDKPLHEYNVGTACGDWHSGELNAQNLPAATMIDGTPKGYAFLNVTGNQYTIDYKVAGQPKEMQIEIFNPKFVARGRRTLAGIYANFFMGHEGNPVEYRIDDAAWRPMKYTKERDPGFAWSVARWDTANELLRGRRPSNPVESTHLWRGDIPINLPAGEHRIEVRATDMFGRTFTRQSSYQLLDPIFQPK